MIDQQTSECPNCLKQVRVKSELLGKTLRCPYCEQKFRLSSVRSNANLESTVHSLAEANRDTSIESATASSADSTSRSRESVTSNPKSVDSSGKAIKTGKLGRFELRSVLGSGGFGRVYLAYDPPMDREIALKVPLFDSNDKVRIQRFFAEAKAAGRLRHPNIVPTFDCGQADGKYYIATAFIAGKPLSDRIKEGAVSVRQGVQWVRDLADALHYAHSQGVVHRDIKPHNVMLDSANTPHLMDFGLAKRTGDDSAMTTDGALLGTPAYMSPEQARGEVTKIGPASDQYSLGVVLFELLTLKRPFEGSPHAVVAMVAHSKPPRPRSINPTIPKPLELLCMRAMDNEVSRRFSSCGEFAKELQRWLDNKPTLTKAPSPLQAIQATIIQRPKHSIAAAIAVAVVAIATWFAVKPKASEPRVANASASSLPTSGTLASEALQVSQDSSSAIATKLQSNPAKLPAPPASVAPTATITEAQGSPAPGLTSTAPPSPQTPATSPASLIDSRTWAAWQNLFDGQDVSQWQTLGQFRIQDGVLSSNNMRSNAISKKEYENFDLQFEWRLAAGGNSGVYYREKVTSAVVAGNEYQLLDDPAFAATQGPRYQTGSLYGLLAPSQAATKPIGEWNLSRIICVDSKVEHWLNGVQVVAYDTDSADWNKLYAESAFAGKTSIAARRKGVILLQGHTGEVSFRSIRIRELMN